MAKKTESSPLAEALLRRKELEQRIQRLKALRELDVYVRRIKRVPAAEGFDDVIADCPVLTAGQVDAEFNFYARQLRMCDARIQQANWTTMIDLEGCLTDYVIPPEIDEVQKQTVAKVQADIAPQNQPPAARRR